MTSSILDGPYRRLSWWDVAPWIAGVALAFFLFGFHAGVICESNRNAAIQETVWRGR